MRESALERKFREAVERAGGKAAKWVSPGNNGVPDRIVILPFGRVIFVELKAPGKPLRPLQRKWRRILEDMGQEYFKVDCYADIDRFIREVVND